MYLGIYASVDLSPAETINYLMKLSLSEPIDLLLNLKIRKLSVLVMISIYHNM